MKRFSISDIECLTGIKAHTIRIWEQRYAIVEPKRTETNIRFYDNTDLKKFLNVSTLIQHGFKISEIARMSEEVMEKKVTDIAHENNPCDKVNEMVTAMLKLDEPTFDSILTQHITEMGIEKTMVNLIFPFMRKIGILWQAGSINPAHEHFTTHLIKQKLIIHTAELQPIHNFQAKKFLLFLPEGESHETGLLFANYLIKSRGHHALYLGQNLPLADLSKVADYYQPDVAMTVLTNELTFGSTAVLLDKLVKSLNKIPLMVSGPLVMHDAIKDNECLKILRSVDELLGFIQNETRIDNHFFAC